MYELQPFPDNGTLPTHFSYPTIAMTLLTHPMALHTTMTASAQSTTINATRSNYTPVTSTAVATAETGYQHHHERGRSTSVERRRRPEGVNARQNSRTVSKPQDTQCKACATYAHSMKDCKFFPRVGACLDCITNNPSDTKENMTRYRKMIHPDAKKDANDSYLKVLQDNCLPEHTDLDELADQELTNASSWNDGGNDYSVSICHMAHSPRQPEVVSQTQATIWCTPCADPMAANMDIHPVRYLDPHVFRMIPSKMDHIVTNTLPSENHLAIKTEDATTPHKVSKVAGQC